MKKAAGNALPTAPRAARLIAGAGPRTAALERLAEAATLLGFTGAEVDHAQRLPSLQGPAHEAKRAKHVSRALELAALARLRYPFALFTAAL